MVVFVSCKIMKEKTNHFMYAIFVVYCCFLSINVLRIR